MLRQQNSVPNAMVHWLVLVQGVFELIETTVLLVLLPVAGTVVLSLVVELSATVELDPVVELSPTVLLLDDPTPVVVLPTVWLAAVVALLMTGVVAFTTPLVALTTPDVALLRVLFTAPIVLFTAWTVPFTAPEVALLTALVAFYTTVVEVVVVYALVERARRAITAVERIDFI